MLTWSNWKTEPRSNRYHYATRFAKRLPVYFVQVTDPEPGGSQTEKVADHDITLVHLGKDYGAGQTKRFLNILDQRGHTKPLYWIYNPRYMDICRRRPSTLKVYHATEDYFGKHEEQSLADDALIRDYANMVRSIDLVVAVTDPVADNVRNRGKYGGPMLVLKNGCDAAHWISATKDAPRSDARIAIYQGAVNGRLDYDLIGKIVTQMPDWTFWFCGSAAYAPQPQWNKICAQPNVRAFGQINPDLIAQLQARATVGIIPFRQYSLIQSSLPLKAYEYVASGLPVTTVPIPELDRLPDLFQSAATADRFIEQMQAGAATRWSPAHLERRFAAARSVSYDRRFEELLEGAGPIHLNNKAEIEAAAARRKMSARTKPATGNRRDARSGPPRKRVLIAYSGTGIHVQTTVDYLSSLARYIDGEVEFVHVTHGARLNVDFSRYDVIFQNYCVRSPFGVVCEDFSEGLASFKGPKVMAVQDEYDRTADLLDAIERVGFDVVLTCIPSDQVERIYPAARFPNTEFVQILTGYVPEDLDKVAEYAMPLRERPNVIGYRGRDIGPRYGRLGFDKLEIGRRMRAACEARGLPCDIDWQEDSRIYGLDWFRFMGSSRTTLGTESGSNVFDFDQSIRRMYNDLSEKNGGPLTYEEFLPLIRDKDASMDMGQISPKFFEAAALRTPLVLLRGRYSDILTPYEHYIPIEKDYSNIDQVLDSLDDFDMLEAMADRTYEHLVGSGAFSYESFVQEIDALLDSKIEQLRANPRPPLPKPFVKREEHAVPEEDLHLVIETPSAAPHHPLYFKTRELQLKSDRYERHAKHLANVYPPEIDRLRRVIVEEDARLNSAYSAEIQRLTAAYEAELQKLAAEIAQLRKALHRRPVGV
jgi:hypothetical protein